MQGVVGGVSPRTLESGQTPAQYPGQISANTTFLQTGAGGFARISTALQALNQTQNVFTLSNAVGVVEADITALQGQVATLQSQVATLQTQVALFQAFQNSFNYFQIEVSTGTIFLDQRTIYKRSFVINGALNTALTVFTYPHGVAAINYIVNIQAMAGAATALQYPITFLNAATAPTLTTALSIWADATNIYVSVGNTTFAGIQVLATMWYTATNR